MSSFNKFSLFYTALTPSFVILKLLGVITWSWWIVMSPWLFAVALTTSFFIILVLAAWGETK